MSTNQTPTIDTPSRPRIVRIRHCAQCGSAMHNDVLDRYETKCAHCRSQPAPPPAGRFTCHACHGMGVYHFMAHGAPESEYCAMCNGVGHLDEAIAARLRDIILASARSEATA